MIIMIIAVLSGRCIRSPIVLGGEGQSLGTKDALSIGALDTHFRLWFIHESHHLFALNRVVHVLNCVIFVFNRTIFAFILHHFSFGYKKRCKSLLVPLSTNQLQGQINIGTDWILRFQNGCNKVVTELRVVQFWSEITIVTSNQKSRVWFQTKLHDSKFNNHSLFCLDDIRIFNESKSWTSVNVNFFLCKCLSTKSSIQPNCLFAFAHLTILTKPWSL